jgi:hypothetical protein
MTVHSSDATCSASLHHPLVELSSKEPRSHAKQAHAHCNEANYHPTEELHKRHGSLSCFACMCSLAVIAMCMRMAIHCRTQPVTVLCSIC